MSLTLRPIQGTRSLSCFAIVFARCPFLLPAPATMQQGLWDPCVFVGMLALLSMPHRWEPSVWFLTDVLFPQLMEYGFMKSVCLASAIMVRWFIEPSSESYFIFCAVVLVFMGSSVFGSIVDVIIFHIQVLVLGEIIPL